MNAAVLATLSLVASGALHGLLFLGLVRSARGAERAWDELAPARFVGNTFEIETLDAPTPAPPSPSPGPASDSEPESAASPASPEAPSEPAPPVPPPAPAAPTPLPAEPPEPVTPSALEPSSGASALPPREQGRAVAPAPTPAAPAASAAPGTPAAEASASAGPAMAASMAAPAYGQDSLPANTVSVAKAFTRAVPRIASADKVWHGLAIGAAGSAVFEIQVDARGKVVGQGTVLDKPAPAQHLARIVGRTVLLLRNQTFAASAEGGPPANQRFELSAVIRQVPALEDSFAEPEDLRQIGRLVEPTRVRPGKANFTFNSGRQVELTLRLLDP
ncbi:MAG TPA: hypothetical protein VI197_17340 [Polyangiaceae bacterium]